MLANRDGKVARPMATLPYPWPFYWSMLSLIFLLADYFADEIKPFIFLQPQAKTTCFTSPKTIVNNLMDMRDERSFFLRIDDVITVPEDQTRVAIDIEEVEIVITDDESMYENTTILTCAYASICS